MAKVYCGFCGGSGKHIRNSGTSESREETCPICNGGGYSTRQDESLLDGTSKAAMMWKGLLDGASNEAVNHPSHYGGNTTYETIKVIMAWGLGFNLGNCVKYLSRAGKKDPTKEIEDLEKALFYLQCEIDERKKGLVK